MDKRPKIDISSNRTDKILEGFGWAAIIGIWTLTLLNYFELPETIPIHYNAAGEADGFGDKTTLLMLPVLSTVMFIGLTILNKHPHLFNYPVKITSENALYQYKNAARLIRVLKLAIVLIFGLIVLGTIQTANGTADGLGIWFLPLTFALTLVPTFYFLIKSFKKRAKG